MENEKYKFVYEKAFKTNGINDDPVLISEGYYEYYRDSNLVDGYFCLWPVNVTDWEGDDSAIMENYGAGNFTPSEILIKKMDRLVGLFDVAINTYMMPGVDYTVKVTHYKNGNYYLNLTITFKGIITKFQDFNRALGSLTINSIQSSKAGVIIEYTADYI